jgi:hypothetical protein
VKDNKIWFVAKTYGYGWTPCTWQGWLVLFVWLIIFVPLTLMVKYNLVLSMIGIFLITGGMLYVAYKKGEKPRWQWSKKKKTGNE